MDDNVHLVSSVPNEVEDLKVSVTDLQYVLVMWRRPTSSVVEEYKVTVTENPGLTRYVSSQEEYISYNISGLEAGTQYTVNVRSVSGRKSKESPASTLTISTSKLLPDQCSVEMSSFTQTYHILEQLLP